MWGREPVGGPFSLIDHTGRPRTNRDFRGKLMLIYFGFTYCPDICPTDLQNIGLALDELGASSGQGPAARLLRLILSGTPPAHLKEYCTTISSAIDRTDR